MERYIAFILRYRWLVIALCTLVMLALAAGGQRITIANDYRILFGDDNPQLLAYEALQNTYTASDSALIAVTPDSGTVFTRETLGAVIELTDAVWRAPWTGRVNSLSNYNHSEAEEDDLSVAPLVEDAESLSAADLARIEQVALNSKEIAGRLIARDGRTAGVAINFVLPEGQEDAAQIEIIEYLNSVLEQARADHPNLRYHMTGTVIIADAFGQATRDDTETLVPLAFIIIVGLSLALLRSVFSALAIVVVIVFVVATTMGGAGWINTVMSPPNGGTPVIIMTIAIADSIHIIASVLLGLRRGLGKNEAIADALRINAYPVFLTSVTTIAGFLTLNSSDSPPYQVLGNMVAFGITWAFIYTMTLLPALLSILPLRAPRSRSEGIMLFDRFADLVIARRTFLLWFSALAVIGLTLGISRIELGDNITENFDERYQIRQDSDYILANLTGLEKLEYSLKADREGGITDPAYLRNVDGFAEWFRGQPETLHVETFSDIMKRLNKSMHGDDPDFYRLPEDPELAAQYLLLYELSLPFGADLNDRIDIAKSATRMIVTLDSVSSKELRALDRRAQEWLHDNVPTFVGEASGVSVMSAHMAERNINSILGTTITAMALISLALIWIFRSLLIGLLSFIPNFVPALMSFGLWGYLVGEVDVAASVVIAVVFGIIVDDTIHFLSKYTKARREGQSTEDSVRYAFRTVGYALWTTTGVLVAGFMVFLLSGFGPANVLGQLVTITVIFAILTDFLLLPALLILFDHKPSPGA